ncbi:MAG: CHASE3 domain-containing protein [Aquabacterium sp.]
MWTIGRKIAAGFALPLLMLLGIGALAYRGIDALTDTSYEVARTHTTLERVTYLMGLLKDGETGQRGYIITGMDSYLAPYISAREKLPQTLQDLKASFAQDPRQLELLRRIQTLSQQKMQEMGTTIEMRRQGQIEATTQRVQSGVGKNLMDDIRALAGQIEQHQRDLLRDRALDVERAAGNARHTLVIGTGICLVLAALAGWLIVRALTEEIASAVKHVRQSSAELQAAATQQASGARESSTAMAEISTTVSELLATSRQIAESAQRVAAVAEDTVSSSSAGEGRVQRSQESIVGIRKQMDQIVGHMLDLGKKSQQIGAVLDIVSELSEQTNILAINATIEASVAGEAGKRFGVVADEIRKLADRVGLAAREIRLLIDDVRGAVNTTVMATETGSKAVDVGTTHVGEVTQSFQQIIGLIGKTTEAAREIELSTKQQASAVEQVKIAIASTAQATKETEVSSGQTFQTAAQLVDLSKDLLRLVQPQAVSGTPG